MFAAHDTEFRYLSLPKRGGASFFKYLKKKGFLRVRECILAGGLVTRGDKPPSQCEPLNLIAKRLSLGRITVTAPVMQDERRARSSRP